MTTLAIIDTETTGTDDYAVATEQAVIIYDTTHGTLYQFSGLIPGVTQEFDGESVSGITQGAIDSAYGYAKECYDKPSSAEICLDRMAEVIAASADFLVAHNAQFDSRFWELDHLEPGDVRPDWLCTMEDFLFATPTGKRDLINIALHYGVPVTSSHRALTDCQLIASIFDRFRTDGTLDDRLQRAIERSQSPTVTLVAQVSFAQKDLVKDWRSATGARFFWDGGSRSWQMAAKLCDLPLDGFPVSYCANAHQATPPHDE